MSADLDFNFKDFVKDAFSYFITKLTAPPFYNDSNNPKEYIEEALAYIFEGVKKNIIYSSRYLIGCKNVNPICIECINNNVAKPKNMGPNSLICKMCSQVDKVHDFSELYKMPKYFERRFLGISKFHNIKDFIKNNVNYKNIQTNDVFGDETLARFYQDFFINDVFFHVNIETSTYLFMNYRFNDNTLVPLCVGVIVENASKSEYMYIGSSSVQSIYTELLEKYHLLYAGDFTQALGGATKTIDIEKFADERIINFKIVHDNLNKFFENDSIQKTESTDFGFLDIQKTENKKIKEPFNMNI